MRDDIVLFVAENDVADYDFQCLSISPPEEKVLAATHCEENSNAKDSAMDGNLESRGRKSQHTYHEIDG